MTERLLMGRKESNQIFFVITNYATCIFCFCCRCKGQHIYYTKKLLNIVISLFDVRTRSNKIERSAGPVGGIGSSVVSTLTSGVKVLVQLTERESFGV